MIDEPGKSSPLDKLLENWGFSRGNPFGSVEADWERRILPEYFVEVEGYDRIKGHKTTIVFAPKGGGKSALRIQLGAAAAPIRVDATALVVEWTDFGRLINRLQSGLRLTIHDHVPELLRAGTLALLNTFSDDSDLLPFLVRAPANLEIQAKRVRQIAPPYRSQLAQLARRFDLLNAEELYTRFRALEPDNEPFDWVIFLAAVEQRALGKLLESAPNHKRLAVHPCARLLCDLNDFPDRPFDPRITPIEEINAFASLARGVGFNTVLFLIDKLDEQKETVDHPETQADLLEPLLAYLPILELPGVGFKFFLSHETRDILVQRPTVRRDRLDDMAVTIHWDEVHLKQLLDIRLAVYSNHRWQGIMALCRPDSVPDSDLSLGEWIEAELLRVAQFSPRRLLLAGQFLFQVHAEQDSSGNLITKAAWDKAIVQLNKRLPPLLMINQKTKNVHIGGREVHLTPRSRAILFALALAGGLCDRDYLRREAWGTTSGVLDEAIDKSVNRLRKVLLDDINDPIYIVTERGRGHSLKNFMLVF